MKPGRKKNTTLECRSGIQPERSLKRMKPNDELKARNLHANKKTRRQMRIVGMYTMYALCFFVGLSVGQML